MKIRISLEKLLLVIFFVCLFGIHVWKIPQIAGNAVLAVSGSLIYVYLFVRRDRKASVIALLTVLAGCLMLLSMLYNGNASIYELLWIPCYMGPAWLLYSRNFDSRLFETVFYLTGGFFLLCMGLGIESSDIFLYGSRNEISKMMVFHMALVYISRQKNGKKIVYLPAILNGIISLWGQGRTGVFCAVFFLAALICIDVLCGSIRKSSGLIKAFFVAAAGLAAVFTVGQKYMKQFLARMNQQGLFTSRSYIWEQYWESLKASWENVAFGNAYSSGYWLNFYQNPHNAFLNLHMEFGIVGLCAVTFGLLCYFFGKLRKKELLLLAVFMTVLLRSFFDWVAFPGSFDVLYWFFLFEVLFGSRFPGRAAEGRNREKNGLRVVNAGRNQERKQI
jgi:hypothetical protein